MVNSSTKARSSPSGRFEATCPPRIVAIAAFHENVNCGADRSNTARANIMGIAVQSTHEEMDGRMDLPVPCCQNLLLKPIIKNPRFAHPSWDIQNDGRPVSRCTRVELPEQVQTGAVNSSRERLCARPAIADSRPRKTVSNPP